MEGKGTIGNPWIQQGEDEDKGQDWLSRHVFHDNAAMIQYSIVTAYKHLNSADINNFIFLLLMKKTTVSIVQGNSRLASSSFRAQDFERGGVSNDEIQQIKQAFDLFDPSRTGLIRPVELQAALASLGAQSTNQPIYQIISDLVEQGRGEIDFNDFLDLMTQRVSNKDTREDLKKVFNFFDLDKTGYISIKNLKAIVKQLGENIDEHELQEMIQKADQDQDGQVSEEEFYNIMTRKGARV